MTKAVNKRDPARAQWQAEISSPERQQARKDKRMFEQKLKELQAQVEGLNLEKTGSLAQQLATVQAQQELLGRQLSEIQRGIEAEAREREDLAKRQRSVEHHLGQVLDIFGTMQNKLASVGSLPEQVLNVDQRSKLADANDEFNVV